MATSFDISLPRDQEPIFPDRCVVCGADAPGHTLKMSTREINWLTWMFWFAGPRVSVHVPACRRCGWWLRWNRFAVLVVTIAVALIVIFWLGPIISPWIPKSLRKIVLMAAALVSLIPVFLWQVFFPPAFDITAFSETIDYEFKSPEYAMQFAARNNAFGSVVEELLQSESDDASEADDDIDDSDDDRDSH